MVWVARGNGGVATSYEVGNVFSDQRYTLRVGVRAWGGGGGEEERRGRRGGGEGGGEGRKMRRRRGGGGGREGEGGL